jgi:predicted metal-dependent hydrolase
MNRPVDLGAKGRPEEGKEGLRQACYLAFFERFNAGRYYEAHDVLEVIWLPTRGESDGAFYKGLIQLAGAFVHVQKERYAPAIALLRRARFHLEQYPTQHHGLSVPKALRLIDNWLARLEEGPPAGGYLREDRLPKLRCEAAKEP